MSSSGETRETDGTTGTGGGGSGNGASEGVVQQATQVIYPQYYQLESRSFSQASKRSCTEN